MHSQSNDDADGEFGGPVYESTDIMSMEINEASRYLFGQVNWQEYIRAGVFLSQNEVNMLLYGFISLNATLLTVLCSFPSVPAAGAHPGQH